MYVAYVQYVHNVHNEMTYYCYCYTCCSDLNNNKPQPRAQYASFHWIPPITCCQAAALFAFLRSAASSRLSYYFYTSDYIAPQQWAVNIRFFHLKIFQNTFMNIYNSIETILWIKIELSWVSCPLHRCHRINWRNFYFQLFTLAKISILVFAFAFFFVPHRLSLH